MYARYMEDTIIRYNKIVDKIACATAILHAVQITVGVLRSVEAAFILLPSPGGAEKRTPFLNGRYTHTW